MALLAVIWRAGGQGFEPPTAGPSASVEERADSLFALDASDVLEVLPPLPVRPLAGSSAWIKGLAAVRGASIPIVDARHLLGAPAQPALLCNRIIVASLPAPWTGRALGLWVDAVLDVQRLDFSAPQAHPGISPAAGGDRAAVPMRPQLLGPLGPTPWGLAQLVQPRELLDEAGWHELVGRLEGVPS